MLDKASPLLNFYPEKWEIDANGKKQDWKFILKLPFINLEQLFAVLGKVWEDATKWTAVEKQRNKVGTVYIMVQKDNPRFKDLKELATSDDPRMRSVSSGTESSFLASLTRKAGKEGRA